MNARTLAGTMTNTGVWGQTALLDGLRDPGDGRAWSHFVERYRPRLVRLASRVGLGPADAEDAAQVALMEFARSLESFDRSKGSLRQWLFGIARRQALNARRRAPRERVHGRDTRTTAFFERMPERPSAPAPDMDAVHRALTRVREEVSEQTMEAFRLFALLGLPAAVVAEELGITENAVFGAKRRVLERVREHLDTHSDTH